MDWSVDLVWRSGGGTRFDSRGVQVTFLGRVGKVFSLIFTHVGACGGTLLGRVEVTCGSGWGHFFVIFGMCWEVFGSTLGMFSGGFGKAPRGSTNLANHIFQKCLGVFVQRWGYRNTRF